MIVVRVIFYILVFCYSLIYLFPYGYAMEYASKNVLKAYDVAVSNPQGREVSLAYEGKDAMSGDYARSLVLFGYNKVTFTDVSLQGLLGSTLPKEVDQITAVYNVLHPKRIDFTASGAFGDLNGTFDIEKTQTTLHLTPSQLMKRKYSFVLDRSTKTRNDQYIYELRP